jgi:hypothetical protein
MVSICIYENQLGQVTHILEPECGRMISELETNNNAHTKIYQNRDGEMRNLNIRFEIRAERQIQEDESITTDIDKTPTSP